MKKQIFDLLECLPADIDESNIKPEFDIDPEKVKADLHDRISAGKNEKHHRLKKRRRLTVITAVAVLITISLVGGTIIACAMTGVSEEDEMQQRLTEEFNARVNELARNDPEENIFLFPSTKIEFQAVSEERKKVCDIVNKYRNDKYKDYYAYYVKDYDDYPTVEDHFVFFQFVIDLCDVYRTEELTIEEKMRILNYIREIDREMESGFAPNSEQMTNYNVEKRYPEEYLLWGKAWTAVTEIIKESGFDNKFGWGYYEYTSKNRLYPKSDIIDNGESSVDGSDSYISE